MRAACSAQSGEGVLERALVRFNGGARHRVLHKHLVVIALKRVPGGGLHTHVGGNTSEHDGVDAASSELGVELCAVKSTPLALGDQNIAGLGVEFGHQGCEICRTTRNAARWRIGDGVQEIFAVGQIAHCHQDDGCMVLAKRLDELGGIGNDFSAGSGKHIHADNAVLEVDQNEGRCLGINVQCRSVHG